MKKFVLDVAEMRCADAYTIQDKGVDGLALMERAGIALADEAEKTLDLRGKRIRVKVLCVCGGGNNGGDGFVCARVLRARGIDAEVLCFAEKLSAECAENKKRFIEIGGLVFESMPKVDYALVVDCLLGTGFHGALHGKMKETVEKLNALKERGTKILSADIPSGVDGQNGAVDGVAVSADKTLCIGERKLGCYLGDGIDCSGEVLRADIGIALPSNTYTTIIEKEEIASLLPKRKRNSNKGTYGKVAIVAGSMQYLGAGYLVASSCMRAGAGYTTLFLPSEMILPFVGKLPEALLTALNDGGRVAFNEKSFARLLPFDAVAYGSGLGISQDVALGAKWLIENYTGKLVLDADALNSLVKFDCLVALKNKKCEVVLTPHLKEFARLCNQSLEYVFQNGVEEAKSFAKEYGVSVLLKSATSLITDGENSALQIRGNSALAKAGSGDVLTGIVTALCGNGLPVYESAKIGSYILGVCAELYCENNDERSMLATDAIGLIGKAFRFVTIS